MSEMTIDVTYGMRTSVGVIGITTSITKPSSQRLITCGAEGLQGHSQVHPCNTPDVQVHEDSYFCTSIYLGTTYFLTNNKTRLAAKQNHHTGYTRTWQYMSRFLVRAPGLEPGPPMAARCRGVRLQSGALPTELSAVIEPSRLAFISVSDKLGEKNSFKN